MIINRLALRSQIILGVLLCLLLVLGVAGFVLTRAMNTWTLIRFDQVLAGKAEVIMSLTEQEIEGVEVEFVPAVQPVYADLENPDYFEVRGSDNRLIANSPSLHSGMTFSGIAPDEYLRKVNITLPNGNPGRLYIKRFLPVIDLPEVDESKEVRQKINNLVPELVTVYVATDRSDLILTQNRNRNTLLFAGTAVLFLTGLLIMTLVKYLIEPIYDVARQISRLSGNTFNQRLALARPIPEIQGLVNEFNGMLNRVEESFGRERRFSSDLAHELRTPLAELKTASEVCLKWPEDKDLARRFYSDVLEATVQMESLVESMLALSRAESGVENLVTENFDLVALAKQRMARMANDRHAVRTIEYTGPASYMIDSSPDYWIRILNNLIDNALHYSPKTSTVRIQLTGGESEFEFQVNNVTDNLEQKDLNQMFDRLWRKDQVRTGNSYSGIGLALVRVYADRLKLNLSCTLDQNAVFSLSLSGPVKV